MNPLSTAMNPAPSNDAPFIIEHRRVPLGGRDFRPEAKLLLTPALRTSGLLGKLTGETALPLLTLLSFLTPNGRIAPSLHEMGQALGLSAHGVRDFIDPLTRLVFEDVALAIPRLGESGIDGYLLSPKAFAQVEEGVVETQETVPEPPGYALAGREAVVAASRARYARPRAEVEREIERALGHDPAQLEDTPEGEARRRLYSLGVPQGEIEPLLEGFGVDDVLRQLDWLPLRGAKSPARFVVAAIRGRYEPPAGHQPQQQATVNQPIPVDVTTTVEVQGELASGVPANPVAEVSEELPSEVIPLDDLPDMRWDLE